MDRYEVRVLKDLNCHLVLDIGAALDIRLVKIREVPAPSMTNEDAYLFGQVVR